jgi:hypothetical protein
MSLHFPPPVDQVLHPEFNRNTGIRLRTDGSDIDLTVTTYGLSVSSLDARRLEEAAIWAGLHTQPDADLSGPLFVFRVGGWYFRARVNLGDGSPSKREELRLAFTKARTTSTSGAWTITFRLVDSMTRRTTAIRTLAFPARLQRRAASVLLSFLADAPEHGARRRACFGDSRSDRDLFESLHVSERIA